VRRREGDPDHWIQATGEPLDQNLHMVTHIGGAGFERIYFRLRSCEVSSAKGLYEHVTHLLGGGSVVDRWRNKKHLEKSESG
jgi:hypothetical protein